MRHPYFLFRSAYKLFRPGDVEYAMEECEDMFRTVAEMIVSKAQVRISDKPMLILQNASVCQTDYHAKTS